MIQFVHNHIIEEIRTNTRTDTVFVLTAIILNLISLAINSSIAGSGSGYIKTILLFIFVGLIIVINLVVEIGLIKGRQTRIKLISGLIQIYKDNGVDKYYDVSLLQNYRTRYNLFMLAVLFTGVVAIIVPFIMLG